MLAKWAAMAPPSVCPTRTGGVWQVHSIRSSIQARTPSASGGASNMPEAPWPGRSGAMTRCVATRRGIRSSHCAPYAPGPCSSTIGGPAPPSRTAVATPFSDSRRSTTGSRASNCWRTVSPASRVIAEAGASVESEIEARWVFMAFLASCLRDDSRTTTVTRGPASPLPRNHPQDAPRRVGSFRRWDAIRGAGGRTRRPWLRPGMARPACRGCCSRGDRSCARSGTTPRRSPCWCARRRSDEAPRARAP